MEIGLLVQNKEIKRGTRSCPYRQRAKFIR